MQTWDVIKAPVVTEKALKLLERPDDEGAQVLAFEVHPKASKHDIKQAVEKIFKVKVNHVRVLNRPGKLVHRFGRLVGQHQNWKQAYVTLKKGERITQYSEVI
jgi:large subunit ribosomal protein L23